MVQVILTGECRAPRINVGGVRGEKSFPWRGWTEEQVRGLAQALQNSGVGRGAHMAQCSTREDVFRQLCS